jgi:hypothetical protein
MTPSTTSCDAFEMPKQPNPSDRVSYKCPVCEKRYKVPRSKASAEACGPCLREIAEFKAAETARREQAEAERQRQIEASEKEAAERAIRKAEQRQQMQACVAWCPDPIIPSFDDSNDEQATAPEYNELVDRQ